MTITLNTSPTTKDLNLSPSNLKRQVHQKIDLMKVAAVPAAQTSIKTSIDCSVSKTTAFGSTFLKTAVEAKYPEHAKVINPAIDLLSESVSNCARKKIHRVLDTKIDASVEFTADKTRKAVCNCADLSIDKSAACVKKVPISTCRV